MWNHPTSGEVTGYNPYSLHTGLARRTQEGYGNIDNGIHPRRWCCHQLWASEIPSVDSPVMICNMAQADRLWEKSPCSCGSTFSHNRPALGGYVVHDGSNWVSQHEFVEKEVTILLVLQLTLEYMHILNPKHYACQLVLLSTLWCEKISGNDSWEDLAI